MKGYYLMPHPPIMIPEIGRGEERKIDTTITSCKEVAKRISELDIETIIIISPHGLVFRDGIAIITETMLSGNFSKFGARNIKMNIKIDTELTNEIIKASSKNNIVTVSLDSDSVKYYDQQLELDHGAMVPLYYVNKEKYKIVHITYGMLSPTQLYHFGMILNESVEKLGKKVTLIASGDLSHRLTHDGPYPFSPYGATFDNKLIEILKNGNIKELPLIQLKKNLYIIFTLIHKFYRLALLDVILNAAFVKIIVLHIIKLIRNFVQVKVLLIYYCSILKALV